MLGWFYEFGPHYDGVLSSGASGGAFGPFHGQRFRTTPFFKGSWSDHSCLGVLPGLLELRNKRDHPWALEIGLFLLFIDIQLGFDPAMLFGADP